MKHLWRWRHTIHAVTGLLSGILTIAAAMIVLNWLGYAFYFDHLHNVLGNIFTVLCVILVLSGVFTQILMKSVNMDWKTNKLIRIKGIHKYFGYLIILGA